MHICGNTQCSFDTNWPFVLFPVFSGDAEYATYDWLATWHTSLAGLFGDPTVMF